MTEKLYWDELPGCIGRVLAKSNKDGVVRVLVDFEYEGESLGIMWVDILTIDIRRGWHV